MKITKKLGAGWNGKAELMHSEGYWTNGHWLLRDDVVACSAPPTSDRTPPVKQLVDKELKTAVVAAENSELSIKGVVLLTTPGGTPLCWVQGMYATAFKDFNLFASEESELLPVHMYKDKEFVGLLMPCRAPNFAPATLIAAAKKQWE